MRGTVAAFVAISFFGLGADNVSFDGLQPGTMPPYWTATESHPELPGQVAPHWEIARDRSAPSHQTVMAQVASGVPAGESAIAVYDKVVATDADLSVKFKITGGNKTRTAGIVWRLQDQDNYYLLRFSIDESDIVLFRVVNGQARALPVAGPRQNAFGVTHPLRTGEWYIAKVSYRGARFRVDFGNRRLFEVADDGISTRGKTGVWTKAGTTAEFDDFRVDKKR
jgi:hypothetical protein